MYSTDSLEAVSADDPKPVDAHCGGRGQCGEASSLPLSCFGSACVYVQLSLLPPDTCPGFQVWKDRISQEAQAWEEAFGKHLSQTLKGLPLCQPHSLPDNRRLFRDNTDLCPSVRPSRPRPEALPSSPQRLGFCPREQCGCEHPKARSGSSRALPAPTYAPSHPMDPCVAVSFPGGLSGAEADWLSPARHQPGIWCITRRSGNPPGWRNRRAWEPLSLLRAQAGRPLGRPPPRQVQAGLVCTVVPVTCAASQGPLSLGLLSSCASEELPGQGV